MVRNIRHVHVVAFLSLAAFLAVTALTPGQAGAQTQPRPPAKGRYKVKIDSSPQQAAVYWDAGARAAARRLRHRRLHAAHDQGARRAAVKMIVELSGFKPQEQSLDVRKSQTIDLHAGARAAHGAPRFCRPSADGAAGGEVSIDGVPRGTLPNTFELTAGRHQVEVRKAGCKPLLRLVDLPRTSAARATSSLERAEAPDGHAARHLRRGRRRLRRRHRNATRRPRSSTALPAGDHVVEVRKEGVPPWRQSVTVVAGQQIKVAATLRRGRRGRPACASSPTSPTSRSSSTARTRARRRSTMTTSSPGEHIVGARKTRFKP